LDIKNIDVSMFRDELLQSLARVARDALVRAEDYEIQGIFGPIAPGSGLNMAANHLWYAVEALDFYYGLWNSWENQGYRPMDGIEGTSQRVMNVLKQTIVSIISAFEYSVKDTVRYHSGVLNINSNNRLYLGSIMAVSHRDGWLSEKQNNFWIFAREFRNSAVHNNGIAERNMNFSLPSGGILEMRKDNMMRATPRHLTEFLEVITLEYENWCNAFRRARSAKSN
jgi:hypothetical protein